ncbi:hypothetical protein HPB50_010692 [Hyalomma asiaticum]|uniref:Uncharacterized protein n=1 Tax=Hyalomma asiaticum TaxID=266040 RepID=A0ACB7SD95_HYAAI|nr:hypothetical protein HPB50_010692 [Hyalomma asiaticum]
MVYSKESKEINSSQRRAEEEEDGSVIGSEQARAREQKQRSTCGEAIDPPWARKERKARAWLGPGPGPAPGLSRNAAAHAHLMTQPPMRLLIRCHSAGPAIEGGRRGETGRCPRWTDVTEPGDQRGGESE